MLTLAEIQAHLQRVKYLPGWSFQAREGRWEGHHLVIQANLENSYRPGEFLLLDIHSKIPPMRDTSQFDEWLVWRLCRIASHEVREWYKVDGKAPFDPHQEGSDRDAT